MNFENPNPKQQDQINELFEKDNNIDIKKIPSIETTNPPEISPETKEIYADFLLYKKYFEIIQILNERKNENNISNNDKTFENILKESIFNTTKIKKVSYINYKETLSSYISKKINITYTIHKKKGKPEEIEFISDINNIILIRNKLGKNFDIFLQFIQNYNFDIKKFEKNNKNSKILNKFTKKYNIPKNEIFPKYQTKFINYYVHTLYFQSNNKSLFKKNPEIFYLYVIASLNGDNINKKQIPYLNLEEKKINQETENLRNDEEKFIKTKLDNEITQLTNKLDKLKEDKNYKNLIDYINKNNLLINLNSNGKSLSINYINPQDDILTNLQKIYLAINYISTQNNLLSKEVKDEINKLSNFITELFKKGSSQESISSYINSLNQAKYSSINTLKKATPEKLKNQNSKYPDIAVINFLGKNNNQNIQLISSRFEINYNKKNFSPGTKTDVLQTILLIESHFGTDNISKENIIGLKKRNIKIQESDKIRAQLNFINKKITINEQITDDDFKNGDRTKIDDILKNYLNNLNANINTEFPNAKEYKYTNFKDKYLKIKFYQYYYKLYKTSNSEAIKNYIKILSNIFSQITNDPSITQEITKIFENAKIYSKLQQLTSNTNEFLDNYYNLYKEIESLKTLKNGLNKLLSKGEIENINTHKAKYLTEYISDFSNRDNILYETKNTYLLNGESFYKLFDDILSKSLYKLPKGFQNYKKISLLGYKQFNLSKNTNITKVPYNNNTKTAFIIPLGTNTFFIINEDGSEQYLYSKNNDKIQITHTNAIIEKSNNGINLYINFLKTNNYKTIINQLAYYYQKNEYYKNLYNNSPNKYKISNQMKQIVYKKNSQNAKILIKSTEKLAKKIGIPADFLMANFLVENPNLDLGLNPYGAVGLIQLVPTTSYGMFTNYPQFSQKIVNKIFEKIKNGEIDFLDSISLQNSGNNYKLRTQNSILKKEIDKYISSNNIDLNNMTQEQEEELKSKIKNIILNTTNGKQSLLIPAIISSTFTLEEYFDIVIYYYFKDKSIKNNISPADLTKDIFNPKIKLYNSLRHYSDIYSSNQSMDLNGDHSVQTREFRIQYVGKSLNYLPQKPTRNNK